MYGTFRAKFPAKCVGCGQRILPGQFIAVVKPGIDLERRAYRHSGCEVVVDSDTLTAENELRLETVAENEYDVWAADQWFQARVELRDQHQDGFGHMDGPSRSCDFCVRGHIGQVYSEPDGGWVHPDIRDGNAFGRYEHQQELRAFEAEMNWENEMEARYS